MSLFHAALKRRGGSNSRALVVIRSFSCVFFGSLCYRWDRVRHRVWQGLVIWLKVGMVLAVALIAAGKFKLRHLEAYEVEDFSVWSWNWVLQFSRGCYPWGYVISSLHHWRMGWYTFWFHDIILHNIILCTFFSRNLPGLFYKPLRLGGYQ